MSDERAVDKKLMTAVAFSVAFRAAHNVAYTGVDEVQHETVVLQNDEESPAIRVNGTLYVSVNDLIENGVECESFITARDKYCVIALQGGDVRVDQFAWKAKTRGGANIDMGAPAIPYDEDLWVPASLVD